MGNLGIDEVAAARFVEKFWRYLRRDAGIVADGEERRENITRVHGLHRAFGVAVPFLHQVHKAILIERHLIEV